MRSQAERRVGASEVGGSQEVRIAGALGTYTLCYKDMQEQVVGDATRANNNAVVEEGGQAWR